VLDSMKFAMVSAGSDHTCAITSDRKAYCWGRNAEGQLGDGTTHPRRIPTLVLPP
jgi:alpha-tubulin suppressor-like RCC1 family protein